MLNIDRKTASKLLRVSVRTIDRYIRRGRLSAHEENGRIWLDKKEVINLPNAKEPDQRTPMDTVQPAHRQTITVHKSDDTFYKDLYQEAKRALHDYQQKLEQATYRIGQLESQIMHPSYPQQPQAGALQPKPIERDYRSEMHSAELFKKELLDKDKELFLVRDEVRREKTSKIIFAIITYALIILQPILWYVLQR